MLVLLVASVVVAGCGSNDSVWNASVTKMVLTQSDGFGPVYQPTADCPRVWSEYTLVVPGSTLSAWRCARTSEAPYPLTKDSVSRMLTKAELDALIPTLETLKVVNPSSCGVDKPAVSVTLTTPSGSTEYTDSFYSCNDSGPRHALDTDALEQVAHALGQLAFVR